MFIAINLIEDDNTIINSFPILYENNVDDISIIDQIKNNLSFKNYLNSNIHFSHFNNISLNFCYIVNNDSQYYYEKSYKLTDIYGIFDVYNWEDFVIDEIKYLYKCSYKIETGENNVQKIYSEIRSKFPKKINMDTVVNYISSQLKEKYNFLTDQQIILIQNNFKSNIKDE